MKHKILLVITVLIVGCTQNSSFKNVGDIPFDAEVDDNNFVICDKNNIKQHYVRNSSDTPPSYKGEKRGMEKVIMSKYISQKAETQSGYLTIRFIVNCQGETGRFRIEEMDLSYQPIHFENSISKQLLEIVKNLNEWIPRQSQDKIYDFYQYLTFKIQDGQITKILP